jgi:subtilisin family serine protease
VAAGIDWLLAQGVHVVNLSLSETISPRGVRGSLLEAAVIRAAEAGAVVVLAAGNSSESADGTAFNLPAIVVAATDRNGNLAPYSRPLSTGIRWGMVAPGGNASGGEQAQIISTYWIPGRRNGYAWNEGTSRAAPHVAGAAALLASQGIRGQAAVEQLLRTASPADCGTGCRGLLDAAAAVGAAPRTAQAASNPPASSPAATPSEPPPATSAPPGSTAAPAPAPAVATTVVAVAPDPAPPREQAASSPAGDGREPPARSGSTPGGLLLVLAAVALLAVTAVTAVVSWARLRAAEGW